MALLAIGLFLAAAAPEIPDPPTVGPIAPDSFYAGSWYEQARTPTGLTKGCEWAITSYARDEKGRIALRDGCHDGRQDAAERFITGVGEIKDPGANATLLVRYKLGPLRISRTYRIIATNADRTWYISAEPGFERIYIFTREVAAPLETVRGFAARARDLGYKGELEILATPGRDRAPEKP